MKPIPNRPELLAQQAANSPKTSDELYESIHDAIVDSLEQGKINTGELVYEKFGVAITLAMEHRLRHNFYAEGYVLDLVVTRKSCKCTRAYIDRAPNLNV